MTENTKNGPRRLVPRLFYKRGSLLRTIPNRTGHNTAHGAARPVSIAVTIVVAMVMILMVVVVGVVMIVGTMRVALVALPFVLARHLHDIARARE